MTSDELTEIAMKVYKIIEQVRLKQMRSEKTIATRDWFDKRYGESVMRKLVAQKLIYPYAFGTREERDPEGQPVKRRKGAIYYRVADVESAIEDYNIYKTLRESYKNRRKEFRERMRSLGETGPV